MVWVRLTESIEQRLTKAAKSARQDESCARFARQSSHILKVLKMFTMPTAFGNASGRGKKKTVPLEVVMKRFGLSPQRVR